MHLLKPAPTDMPSGIWQMDSSKVRSGAFATIISLMHAHKQTDLPPVLPGMPLRIWQVDSSVLTGLWQLLFLCPIHLPARPCASGRWVAAC